ncbi:MAG: PQQ-dependent sugar dehydrogenase [Myxococcota bacterium]|nr:PQQ-dependent sugar dehydrogenase [Myxococcota bacterium]
MNTRESLLIGLVLAASGVLMLPDAARASGLDERPANPTCLAPERPPAGGAIDVTLERFVPASSAIAMRQSPVDAGVWFVAELGGAIARFEEQTSGSPTRTTLLDLSDVMGDTSVEGGLLGMALHPDFASNGEVYVYYTVTNSGSRTSVISRFVTSDGGLTLPSSSEEVLFTVAQPAFNHNGGAIEFGPDGLFYIALGDGGVSANAQDTSNLLGNILRIDVDSGDPYAIPPTNPFAQGGGAPEIYAWGLRNPWRFTFDSASGELWAGDVGSNQWEEVNLIELGGNYGWPYREGAHCRSAPACNDPDLIDPVFEDSHADGVAAITGGYVYRGSAIAGLQGAYVYRDYLDGRLWAVFFDAQGAPSRQLLANTSGQALSFAEDRDGELYVMRRFGGTNDVSKLVPANGSGAASGPPQLLSETGCVDPEDPTQPAPGVIPYDLRVPLWTDGAGKARWLAIPDGTTIDVDAAGDLHFPIGSVLIKEFELFGERIETRLLVRHDDGDWAGYTYQWNTQGTDAVLLTGGKTVSPGGQDYQIPSRPQCLQCHTQQAGNTLGPEIWQLNRDLYYPATGRTDNQLTTLEAIGMLTDPLPGPVSELPALPGADETEVPVDLRARAYLHSNCANCHRPGTTVPSQLDFRYDTAWPDMNACNEPPVAGDAGVPGARLLEAGDPASSVISLRMHAVDANRMPPVGRLLVDTQAVAMIDSWISGWIAEDDVCLGPDSDFDQVLDADDNCPGAANGGQEDSDGDGVGDVCQVPEPDASLLTVVALGTLAVLRRRRSAGA